MPGLQQDESYLIGSEAAIKALSKKELAYVLVLSDSHGNYDVLYDVLQECGSRLDALIFCGDGSEDIVRLFEDALQEDPVHGALRKIFPPVIAFVRGNGDAESYAYNNGDKREICIVPQAQNITICGKNLFVTHGHKYSVDFGLDYASQVSERLGVDYFFYGHTHIPRNKKIKHTTFINAGSCSRPRGGFPPSCAILKIQKDLSNDPCDFFEIKQSRFGGIKLEKIRI